MQNNKGNIGITEKDNDYKKIGICIYYNKRNIYKDVMLDLINQLITEEPSKKTKRIQKMPKKYLNNIKKQEVDRKDEDLLNKLRYISLQNEEDNEYKNFPDEYWKELCEISNEEKFLDVNDSINIENYEEVSNNIDLNPIDRVNKQYISSNNQEKIVPCLFPGNCCFIENSLIEASLLVNHASSSNFDSLYDSNNF